MSRRSSTKRCQTINQNYQDPSRGTIRLDHPGPPSCRHAGRATPGSQLAEQRTEAITDKASVPQPALALVYGAAAAVLVSVR